MPIEETNKENTEEISDHESGTNKPEVCEVPECGNNGDKGGCRAEPTKLGTAEQK